MLRDSFYSVQLKSFVGSEVSADVTFNGQHPVFEGHFPGQPVVPGVCMMQIVKDLLEEKLDRKLILTDGDNIKFLAVIDPRVNATVEVRISYQETAGSIAVTASLFSGSQTFFKLKGNYSAS